MLKNKDILRFTIPLLHYCNLSCGYCHVPNQRHEYLDFEVYKKGVDFFYELPGTYKNLVLYGGEPLLLKNEELDQFITYAVEKKAQHPEKVFEITLITNLTVYRDSLLPILEKVDSLCVSIDGKADSHNANRGLFDLTYKNFQKLRQSEKIMKNISINKVVNKLNVVNFYDDVVYLLDEFKVPLYYNQALSVGDWDEKSVDIFEAELKKIFKFSTKKQLFGTLKNFFKIPMRSCPYGTLSMSLNGKVYNCEFISNDYINQPDPVVDLVTGILHNKDIESCHYDISSKKCLEESCLHCGTTCVNFSFQNGKRIKDEGVETLRKLKRLKSSYLPFFTPILEDIYPNGVELSVVFSSYQDIFALYNFIFTFWGYFQTKRFVIYADITDTKIAIYKKLLDVILKKSRQVSNKEVDVEIVFISSVEKKDAHIDLARGLFYYRSQYLGSICSELSPFFVM